LFRNKTDVTVRDIINLAPDNLLAERERERGREIERERERERSHGCFYDHFYEDFNSDCKFYREKFSNFNTTARAKGCYEIISS